MADTPSLDLDELERQTRHAAKVQATLGSRVSLETDVVLRLIEEVRRLRAAVEEPQ